MNLDNKLLTALNAFDSANSQDPNSEIVNGQAVPKELIYGQRMSQCLENFSPNSSEVLQLAVRCQHIKRWCSFRGDYPEGLQGYRKWRVDLGAFHAKTANKILAEIGYQADTFERIEQLLRKKNIKGDKEVQTLEDVACLVFLEHYLEAFANKHTEEKLINIIQKTWSKMSDEGHEAASQLPLKKPLLALVTKALS